MPRLEYSPPSRSRHVPVLLRETIQALQLAPGLIVVDGTVGAGGHSREILARIAPVSAGSTGTIGSQAGAVAAAPISFSPFPPGGGGKGSPAMDRENDWRANPPLPPLAKGGRAQGPSDYGEGPAGRLIGLDRDAMMLEIAARHLSSPACRLIQASYAELPRVLAELEIPAVDRILLDLGLSSDQLADAGRGFSFSSDGPLDLRFDTGTGTSAADLLARIDETELADLLYRYGEEPDSRRIARRIVERRSRRPIVTARDLAEIVVPHDRSERRGAHEKHPATRVFQALRIAVNRELEQLETFLGEALPDCLKPGGIVAVISFHSLEDRLVKQALRESTLWKTPHPRPLVPSPAEQRFNPRSRSAKLRVAQRI